MPFHLTFHSWQESWVARSRAAGDPGVASWRPPSDFSRVDFRCCVDQTITLFALFISEIMTVAGADQRQIDDDACEGNPQLLDRALAPQIPPSSSFSWMARVRPFLLPAPGFLARSPELLARSQKEHGIVRSCAYIKIN